MEDDTIEDNKDVSSTERHTRLVISYIGYGLLILIPTVIMWALLFKSLYKFMQGEYDSMTMHGLAGREWLVTLVTSLVTLTVTITIEIAFAIIAVMSAYEKHRTWSSFRFHRLLKMILFRVILTMGLFCLRYFADLPWFTCLASRMGYQVFIFFLLDMTVNNIIEYLIPGLLYLWRLRKPPQDRKGNNDLKEPFELSDEYLEIIYRQFFMYMGITVFPMVTLFTFVANLLEFNLDRYRMLYFCKKPRGFMAGGRKIISIYLFLAAFFALISFPLGPVWFGKPLGPWLCWPCTVYSSVQGKSGGVCKPEFEPLQCYDNQGAVLLPTTLRDKLNELQSNNQSLSVAADAWFKTNDHLFSSRRCGCRPCLNVINCDCSAPPVLECPKMPPRICNVSNVTFATAIACQSDLDCSSLKTDIRCIDNQNFTDARCTKPRHQYSLVQSKAHTATCVGGLNAGRLCTTHADCSGGSCDLYCPMNKDLSNEATWRSTNDCWNCPESKTSYMVNPVAAKASWEKTSFCSYCTWNTRICDKNYHLSNVFEG